MSRLRLSLALTTCFLGQTAPVLAAPDAPDASSGERAEDEAPSGATEQLSLDNGLRVVLHPDADAAGVSICTAYDAGIRRDPEFAPGTAHVVVELLRDGGRPPGARDYAEVIARRGGTRTAELTHDAAVFCTNLPSSELGLALWLEKGRFTTYGFTQTALEAAELRLEAEFERSDADVFAGRARTRLRHLAFQGQDPYAGSVVPRPEELAALELDELKAFHREHYNAANAVVAISGKFDPAQARRLVKNGLSAAPQGRVLGEVAIEVPHQTTGRFSMIEDPRSKVPAALYAWVLPSRGTEARRALEVATTTLASESRLGGSLIGRGRAAQSLEQRLSGHYGPELMSLAIVGTNSRSLGAIESALGAELAKMGRFGITPTEMAEAESRLEQERRSALSSSQGQSEALSRGVLFGASPSVILSPEVDEVEVSNVALARAVREYLDARRRTIIEVYPKGWQDPWQVPMPRYHVVSAGESLGRIAAQNGTTVAVIAKMNGIDPKKPIFPGQKLRVPRGKASPQVKLVSHKVKRGDTLSGLSHRYGVSVEQIAAVNGISKDRAIFVGQEIRIPAGGRTSGGSSSESKPSQASQPGHVVKKGETLSGIAARYGVSTAALASANGLNQKSTIRVGQKLSIPARGAATASAKGATRTVHTVRSGETLSEIAKRYGVSVASITRANNISRKKPIRVGQKLIIPR